MEFIEAVNGDVFIDLNDEETTLFYAGDDDRHEVETFIMDEVVAREIDCTVRVFDTNKEEVWTIFAAE